MNPHTQITEAMQSLNTIIAHEPSTTTDSETRRAWRKLKDALPAVAALLDEHHDGGCYCANKHDHGQTITCPHCKANQHIYMNQL